MVARKTKKAATPKTSDTVTRHKIRSISADGALKRLTLTTSSTRKTMFPVQRFAMVGRGDTVILKDGLQRKIWVAAESGQGNIPVFPIFEIFGTYFLAGETVQTRVAELSTPQELADFETLEVFHYRGIDFAGLDERQASLQKKGKGGRRAILILQIKLGTRWTTAGYLELQMPLMMAKPRHDAFDRRFAHPTLRVSWKSWRKGGQTLVNRIARIARVVVHPELRGAGLSSILVQSALHFARERWHVGGRRALFVEISAEMLRHIDFVSASGFHFLGNTEGNKSRLAKDLGSIRRGAKGASGIMSLQRRYYSLFEDYRAATGDTFENLHARVAELLSRDNPWEDMTFDEWLALRPVIRSPIPYFMIGLDAYSDAYVREAAKPVPRAASRQRKTKLPHLELAELEIWSRYDVPHTPHNRLIMDCFGITAKTLKTKLVGPISTEMQSGTVTFVAGSSGCGKSILLSSIDPQWKSGTVTTFGAINPKTYTVGWLRTLPADVPLFEHLATKYNPELAFDALARVGLSEAMLFLRPFEMLSRGQRYRAMLADLILDDADVWLIDEFCSDLDPLAARVVATRLREIVRKRQKIAIVAAANHGHFIQVLKPAQVLKLSLGGNGRTMGWKEYIDGLFDKAI
ncbi:ATP-binding cassette domain-containing protein [Bradyrhizobium sp. CB1650]|uniref:GNAT family N-acetyltransferase n=1 Tax=Bradyrhizobium sp. CB1650 TaxID=3039153 RepID=UPI0024357D75|nr:GNAT family N-acetyltransferase [Bradyrhizobium sp. CB1650]WGD54167.1 ATP-binding cassette domain-containing protein [Bradyrhizobium sp. CB1650]